MKVRRSRFVRGGSEAVEQTLNCLNCDVVLSTKAQSVSLHGDITHQQERESFYIKCSKKKKKSIKCSLLSIQNIMGGGKPAGGRHGSTKDTPS